MHVRERVSEMEMSQRICELFSRVENRYEILYENI